MNPLHLPDQPRVLVVILRRLGDVLLTTPLIRSVKRAHPQASIDALVFTGTEGIFAGNPDLAEIITVPQRSIFVDTSSLIARLYRRSAVTSWIAGSIALSTFCALRTCSAFPHIAKLSFLLLRQVPWRLSIFTL